MNHYRIGEDVPLEDFARAELGETGLLPILLMRKRKGKKKKKGRGAPTPYSATPGAPGYTAPAPGAPGYTAPAPGAPGAPSSGSSSPAPSYDGGEGAPEGEEGAPEGEGYPEEGAAPAPTSAPTAKTAVSAPRLPGIPTTKAARLTPDGQEAPADGTDAPKKEFPTILVVGGLVAAATLAYFLFFRKKK